MWMNLLWQFPAVHSASSSSIMRGIAFGEVMALFKATTLRLRWDRDWDSDSDSDVDVDIVYNKLRQNIVCCWQLLIFLLPCTSDAAKVDAEVEVEVEFDLRLRLIIMPLAAD